MNKISKKFKGGNLKNLNAKIKFSLVKEFMVEEITGSSNFSNIRFDYKNKIFKKLLSTVSGNFNFRLKPQKFDDTLFNVDLSATDVFILVGNNIRYQFSKAKVIGQFKNNDLVISKANFFKNSDLEYSFNNIIMSEEKLVIEKVHFIKEKKSEYTFSNTILNNMDVIKSNLKITNNREISNYIKRKFDIELIGDTDLNISLSGNLKNLNFNLNLNSDLKNTHLEINYLSLIHI